MSLLPLDRGTGPTRALLIALAAAGLLAALLGGCTNKPFDPGSVANQRPVARIFVTTAPGDTLNPTSYYRRTFYWSGSDADGRVVAYYVSIAAKRGATAPWDTTTRTDTTMTFATDDLGRAEAVIRLVCRDDRGALSDTVTQFIPLRNFPPVINFQADYDTVRWSYGAANFRFFALDLDGNATMDSTLRYCLDTADTTIVRRIGTPGADPALCWVERPYDDFAGRTFEIKLTGTPPAARRTLTVSVKDEAQADTRFHWTWDVLEARGPVLLVADSGPNSYVACYRPMMDAIFGPDGWSLYNLGSPLSTDPNDPPQLRNAGLPDRQWVLLETLRQFPVVLWYTGGSGSINLKNSVNAVTQYLIPSEPGKTPGHLLLVSKAVAGSMGNLPQGFLNNVLGIKSTPAPPAVFNVPVGKRAMGQRAGGILPNFSSNDQYNQQALGIQTQSAASEVIYKLEYYQYNVRPPYEPVVGVRVPTYATAPAARSVVLSLQLEGFNLDETTAALRAVLQNELGVTVP